MGPELMRIRACAILVGRAQVSTGLINSVHIMLKKTLKQKLFDDSKGLRVYSQVVGMGTNKPTLFPISL